MDDETTKTIDAPAEKPVRKRNAPIAKRKAQGVDKKSDAPRPATSKPKAAKPTRASTDEPKAAAVTAKQQKRTPAVPEKAPAAKAERYFEGVGRRKTAIARVRLYTKPGDLIVNDKPHTVYFPTIELQKIVEDAMQKMKLWGKFKVTAKIRGGGIHAQAEAFRHGLARCLTKFNPDFRKRLRRAGFLTRDPRMKERKKPGLKKARRAPQWRKR